MCGCLWFACLQVTVSQLLLHGMEMMYVHIRLGPNDLKEHLTGCLMGSQNYFRTVSLCWSCPLVLSWSHVPWCSLMQVSLLHWYSPLRLVTLLKNDQKCLKYSTNSWWSNAGSWKVLACYIGGHHHSGAEVTNTNQTEMQERDKNAKSGAARRNKLGNGWNANRHKISQNIAKLHSCTVLQL